MNIYKILSLDESGKASYNHKSELFILSGVLIDEKFKSKLDIKIRKLKKKYFNDEDIVFHSRDMHRKKGPFLALSDKRINIQFWSEFVSILNNPKISFLFVITNKKEARLRSWLESTILKKSYLQILESFKNHLQANNSYGKIVMESDPTQDLLLIKAHNYYLSENKNYREHVTSLSLVSKRNLDVDVQIADALAPVAGWIYLENVFRRKKGFTREEIIKNVFFREKLMTKTTQVI
ncbi:TPA: hypothetical protein DEP81_01795 [Candidatus Woesebacteria bacterium]|nr:hypothetical protein [Candidatus Woesebacteria bacterium]